jgi:hypothetical protein
VKITYLLGLKKKLDSPGFVAKRRQTFSRRQKKNSEPLPHPYKGAVTLVRQPLGYFSKTNTRLATTATTPGRRAQTNHSYDLG